APRLHDRRERRRRLRHHEGGRARSDPPRRRLAADDRSGGLRNNDLAGRLAELAVDIGANVQPGQLVTVSADVGLEEVVREIAVRAYQRGARFVDVTYFDPKLKRARIERAEGDTLEFVPPWYGERVREIGRLRSARVVVTAPSDPEALRGLDPERLGRD